MENNLKFIGIDVSKGAMGAIRLHNDLAIYYHRKVEEGKNRMSVPNAVRNNNYSPYFCPYKKSNLF